MEEILLLKGGEKTKRVYNLQIFDTPEYFANNILVHNCVISMSILLQICSQQSCEIQASKKALEGTWTRFEIDHAIFDGRIDKRVAQEYIENNGCAYESEETKYKIKQKQGGSRYARR